MTAVTEERAGLSVVTAGMSADELFEEWKRLRALCTSTYAVLDAKVQQWRAATGRAKEQFWAEYAALSADHDVLSAWTEAYHCAWVFARHGRESRFFNSEAGKVPQD
ncbi:MAG: hypothetical protein M3308_01250 [Actinomycetota bacterium]|nr:hypothetical protein [Actinomycetota bacterium]